MMELVSEAVVFAVKAHDGMRRKGSQSPYILHPLEAAVIVGTMTDDQQVIAAAALHDVVEDTPVTAEQVRQIFGSRVGELVASETEDKRENIPPAESWRIRKEETLALLEKTEDLDVLIVWLGDKLANMRAIYRDWKSQGHAMWQRFNQKDPLQQAWYYTTIAQLTKRLAHTSAWAEYNELTQIVFGKGTR